MSEKSHIKGLKGLNNSVIRTDRHAREQGKQANKDITIFGSDSKSRLLHRVCKSNYCSDGKKREKKKGES